MAPVSGAVNGDAMVSGVGPGWVCPILGEFCRACPGPYSVPLMDVRFTTALVREVADVLTAHGFPPITYGSPHWYALLWCLAGVCSGAGDR